MFKVTSRGNYTKTRNFLDKLLHRENFTDLDIYGQMGVEALSQATPVDTGLTAASWEYFIFRNEQWIGIRWVNTNMTEKNGPSVAVLLQYGHATRGGTYVQGIDFVNPAMRPVFDTIIADIWKKVNS